MYPHQSRFKSYLLHPKLLKEEALKIAHFIDELKNITNERCLSSAEQVLIFILIYLFKRKSTDCLIKSGQKSDLIFHGAIKIDELIYKFHFLEQFRQIYLLNLTIEYRIRKLPQAVFDVLLRWSQNKYDLILLDRVPTPFEMLCYQADGKRAVTMDKTAALTGGLVDGKRDAFEFLLHDLIHADLFFKDPELHVQQVEFFKKLKQKVIAEDLLNRADEKFLQDLNYLMSDMNSHQAHLEAHWQAILIQWRLRQENKNSQEALSAQGHDWVRQVTI